uniref:Uncharacterized protein n=1 Tax=Ascaris lumbricoides TaxID=6252 RepID=A0A9J2PIU6_ASCLU
MISVTCNKIFQLLLISEITSNNNEGKFTSPYEYDMCIYSRKTFQKPQKPDKNRIELNLLESI